MRDRWPEKVEDVLRKRGDGASWREATSSEKAQTINISTLN